MLHHNKPKRTIGSMITMVVLFVVCLLFSPPVFATPTFSSGMSKRTAPGPYTAAPILQGDATDTYSLNDDTLTTSRGTQVSGNFYQVADMNQGSVVVWWTPEYGSSDLSGSGKHYLWTLSSAYALSYDYVNNRFILTIGSQSIPISTTITAGTTYSVVARWDVDNTLDGTNYLSLSIDDSHTFGLSARTPTVGAPGTNISIGSLGNNYASSGIIEGLTIYRRPLYDGTYGINVGNGDEINKIYNSGSGTDPVEITGSWDVTFSLPTNGSTGAMSSGTGEAWSHPHTSNLTYVSTTNTGGFMMNGTATSDGWTSTLSMSALATTEKIFSGGYKYTSTGANQFMYHGLSATSGNDYVLRAIGNSDGTCNPKVQVTQSDGSTVIGSLVGSTSSTKAAPDVYIFTWEAPATETEQIQLLNTASSGTCYWHYVEVLSNLLSNPSYETFAGTDPDIPNDWENLTLTSGEGIAETTHVHSGSKAMNITSTNWAARIRQLINSITSGKYFHSGIFYRHDTGGSYIAQQFDIYNLVPEVSSSGTVALANTGEDSYEHLQTVGRSSGTQLEVWNRHGYTNNTSYFDDAYVFLLDDISLTVGPASEANSTENSGEVRVDGRDTYIQSSAVSIADDAGSVEFDYRPRHSASIATNFAENSNADAYILSLYGDSDDYINVYWDSSNTIAMNYSMGGSTGSDTWDATGSIAANTQYTLTLQYTGGSTMVLSVNGTAKITLSSIPSSFGTAPDTVYFGSDTSSGNQGDATFSSFVFDGTPPSISITPLSPDPNNGTTPSIDGTATDAIANVSNVSFQMDGTGGVWTICTATYGSSSVNFTCTVSSALSDGDHTMYLRATDSNGNTTASGSETTTSFTIDATAPSVSVTALSPDPTSDTTPTLTGTATDATTVLTAIEYQVDSTSGSWTTCTADDGAIDETSEAFSCTTSTLLEGSHTIYVRATDNASNTTASGDYATDTFTIDASAPTISLTAVTPDPTTDSTPTLTGSASDNASTISSVQYQSDSTSGSWTACTADDGTFDETTEAFTCQIASLSDGSHTIYVRATDSSSQTTTTSDTFTVDTTGVTGGSIASPAANAYISTSRPTFTWKGFTDDTSGIAKYSLAVRFYGGDVIFNIDNIPVQSNGTYKTDLYTAKYSNFNDGDSSNDTIDLTTKSSIGWGNSSNDGKLKEGKLTWRITVVDHAGNTVSEDRTFYVDFTKPTLSQAGLSSKTQLGVKDGYAVVTSVKPEVIGLAKDNLALDNVRIEFYRQNLFLGAITSESIELIHTIEIDSTELVTSKSFTSALSKSLPLGKYSIYIFVVDKAGNETNPVTINMQLVNERDAQKLLSDEDQDALKEKIKENTHISIPQLEKLAKLNKQQQANNLHIFLSNLQTIAVNSAKGTSSILVKVTNSLFENVVRTLARIQRGVRNSAQQVDKRITEQVKPQEPIIVFNLEGVFTDSLKNTTKEISGASLQLSSELKKNRDAFVAWNNTLTVDVSQGFDNGQKELAQQIAQSNSNTRQALEVFVKGIQQTYIAFSEPLVGSNSFLARVRAGIGAFNSVVFDNNPTVITDVTIQELGADYAVISWKTNHYATGKINYGTDLTYGHEILLEKYEKDHTVKIENLEPNQRYYFEVMNHGKNYVYDAYYSFETPSE